MKAIRKEKLIKILNTHYGEEDCVDLEDIKDLFEKYVDDWYVVDGMFQCCKENNKEIKPYDDEEYDDEEYDDEEYEEITLEETLEYLDWGCNVC